MCEKINKQTIFNTAKISLAAILAIVIALTLQLDFAIATGIVTILTIQPTKKSTISIALDRLYAFITAIIIAYVSFDIFGFTTNAFFMYLIIFIFLCQIFKWYNAMAMNSVLISHFVTQGNMELATLYNEVMIFIIGVGIGIVVNMHLHKRVDYIEELKTQTDEQIKNVLFRMSKRILDKDISDYNGECFIILKNQIRKAKNVADENYNNQFGKDDIYDIEYIKMRDKQIQILFEMYKNIRCLDTTPLTAKKISEFLYEMSKVYHRNNTGNELEKKFLEMDKYMKNQPLPKERKEFEDRARLYMLMRNIDEFIHIKIEFSQKYNTV